MKVKYIDKRHWRRLINHDYTEVKVNNNKFKGIIGLITMNKVREPLIVNVLDESFVAADDGYQWLQVLPDKKRYSITVMFDDNGNPLQYYFDINIKNITQKGNARTVDLCLDVLVLPDGRYELVDEDDLERVLEQGDISKKQYHEAYIIAHQLMIQIHEDFKSMEEKIMYCYKKINKKYNKTKHKPKEKPKSKDKPRDKHKESKRHKPNHKTFENYKNPTL
ncbi:DUF402 domain-containing protein [Staphylococcus massiliensis]|uniref:DUF402 domain-containing protein n=1 Tax=Staphylococcus massiliensis S46 TaxID=1229783 RepID=K9B477_9STAP|nr:DUF402 domain-containing protein [Staphylococcus massiliensis]EKU48600.1 hypothetical protein C273_05315 [Staphylococcus massiliensis S46]PNZ98459.1 DUF402 domain-containing protein [Staphylococcus massiliensis CCUG 55927]